MFIIVHQLRKIYLDYILFDLKRRALTDTLNVLSLSVEFIRPYKLSKCLVRGDTCNVICLPVRDMTWSPRAVYMVTEEGNLLSYRPGYFAAMREDEVPQIVSVAYDWLAGKLYMSHSTNPGMV